MKQKDNNLSPLSILLLLILFYFFLIFFIYLFIYVFCSFFLFTFFPFFLPPLPNLSSYFLRTFSNLLHFIISTHTCVPMHFDYTHAHGKKSKCFLVKSSKARYYVKTSITCFLYLFEISTTYRFRMRFPIYPALSKKKERRKKKNTLEALSRKSI